MRVPSSESRVLSVNVGLPREAAWAGIGRTSIDKAPVAGPVAVGRLGPAGDEPSDTRHHGGVDKAVYAFAREDLDLWAERLGEEIRDGQFGENLTTSGIDVNESEIGERWRIGDVLLEVAQRPHALQRLQELDGPLRLRQPGLGASLRRGGPARPLPAGAGRPARCRAGDELEVLHRPGHGVTVSTMFRALVTDHALLPELLRVDGLVPQARARAEEYVAALA